MVDISLQGGDSIFLERGMPLALKFEGDFTRNAIASGYSDEETNNGFNANVMPEGLLADGPAEFS